MELNHKLLEDLATEHSRWEQEMSAMKKHAINSANHDLNQGMEYPSSETMQIEADLGQVQQNCQTIKKRIQEVAQEIQLLHAKQDMLTNQIRPSPTGVAGAEPVPSKKRSSSTWYETDMDSGIILDRSHELDAQLKAELKAKNAGSNYINAYEEDIHSYENTKFGAEEEEFDEIQTVYSEGVRSEAPPLPSKRPVVRKPAEEEVSPTFSSSSEEMYSLGDISEADERVKKFYGLLPKNNSNNQMEIKTVRMVKRDSKERSISKGGQENTTAAPLPPRGNYQNVHDFLTAYQQNSEESLTYNLKASALPRMDFNKESPPRSTSLVFSQLKKKVKV